MAVRAAAAVLYNPAQLSLVERLCLAHVLIPSKPKLLLALSIKSEILVFLPKRRLARNPCFTMTYAIISHYISSMRFWAVWLRSAAAHVITRLVSQIVQHRA